MKRFLGIMQELEYITQEGTTAPSPLLFFFSAILKFKVNYKACKKDTLQQSNLTVKVCILPVNLEACIPRKINKID